MNVTTLNNVPATPTPLVAAKRMSLANLKSGVIKSPLRVLLYGPEKIGKSTFASGAPKPIWLGLESGTNHLDIKRFDEPQTWTEVLDAVRLLANEPHDFKTLVLDPLGWLEDRLLTKHLLAKHGWESMEELEFSKCWKVALDEWMILISALERCWNRGMNIILIAHSKVKNASPPDGRSFERYEMKLEGRAAAILKEWVDYILFARRKVWIEVTKGERKGKGQTGALVLHTQWSAAFDAGGRPALTEELPLSWSAFLDDYTRVTEGRAARKAELLGQIDAQLAELNEEPVTTKVRGQLQRVHGTADEIQRLEEVTNALAMRIEKKSAAAPAPASETQPKTQEETSK